MFKNGRKKKKEEHYSSDRLETNKKQRPDHMIIIPR